MNVFCAVIKNKMEICLRWIRLADIVIQYDYVSQTNIHQTKQLLNLHLFQLFQSTSFNHGTLSWFKTTNLLAVTTACQLLLLFNFSFKVCRSFLSYINRIELWGDSNLVPTCQICLANAYSYWAVWHYIAPSLRLYC